MLSTTSSAYAASSFTSYSISSSYRNPGSMTVAGGSLWYNESSPTYPYNNHYIGNITMSGAVTDYNISYPSGATNFIIKSLTTGADGNVWFNGRTNLNTLYVGQLNIATGAVTFYPYSMPTYSAPSNLVLGSDGNLWYAVKSAYANSYSYVVYLNPSTGVTTIGKTLDSYASITSITSGPDGNLWYTDDYYNRVQYLIPSGGGGSYTLPTAASNPGSITTGPDGNLWLIESSSGKIVKLTPTGTFTEYTPPAGVSPYALTSGSDGMLWFTDTTNKKIGRITTFGSIVTYAVPTGITDVGRILTGPDGAVWFTSSSSNGKLVRLGY